jgi:peroxiredoxin
MRLCQWSALVVAVLVASCARSSPPPPAEGVAPKGGPATAAENPSSNTEPATVGASNGAATLSAEIGKPAPDFTLPDLDAHPTKLSDYLGKTVVLEWFNPGCPFVHNAHTKGQLKELAKKEMARGVVWLAVNSAAPGKQGYGVEANRAGKAKFALTHPILLDESGKVGHAYGAAHTPHLFVVDTKGVLVYAGAIDNSPDGEGESPTSGQLVNYVEQALDDLRGGTAVRTPRTEAYGCSVKYGA